MFANREAAGRVLAQELSALRDDPDAILLALPRGGVVVASQISFALRLPLDVFVTRKIGAPENPEYAVGAVSETGAVYWNREAAALLSEPERLSAVRAQEQEIARRVALYRQGRPLPPLVGRTVILVDDGLATGATFFASVAVIRKQCPRRMIGALPVASQAAVERARGLLDQLVVLNVPNPFFAVGNFYDDFTQVEDREVLRCLHASRQTRLGKHPEHQ